MCILINVSFRKQGVPTRSKSVINQGVDCQAAYAGWQGWNIGGRMFDLFSEFLEMSEIVLKVNKAL